MGLQLLEDGSAEVLVECEESYLHGKSISVEPIIYLSMEKPWHELRYPADFKGWRPLGSVLLRYLVLESPDGKLQCLIHMEDNDVCCIMEVATDREIYTNPINLRGARILLAISKAAEESYAR